MQHNCVNRAFTLIEVLLTVGIVAIIGTLILTVGRAVMVSAQQSKCASNLRQIGTAVVCYTQDHNGEFPLTTHSLDSASLDQAWIFTLADYLGDVDDVRICPADPKAEQRREEHGTSYLLNSFITVPEVGPFGEKLGGYTNINTIPEPATTPLAFPINFQRGTGMTNDHTHSNAWTSWSAVRKDIQPDCFRYGLADPDGLKGSANYLFVDGHVENIPATTVHGWITSGHNFADPQAYPRPTP